MTIAHAPTIRKGTEARRASPEFRRVRIARGLTQARLARFAGMVSSDVCNIERGRLLVGALRRRRLAVILGYPEEALFSPSAEERSDGR